MYKNKFLILILFCCQAGTSFSQTTDSVISVIKTKYKKVHDNLKNYDTISTSLENWSREEGEAIAYYEGKNVRLIELNYFGETGKSEMEFYFDNNRLFFVFEKQYRYNRPIYWDKKHMQENNDTASCDPAKTIVTAERYYFHNKKLIRWLDNDKKEVDLTLGTNTLAGQGLIAYADRIRDEIRSKK